MSQASEIVSRYRDKGFSGDALRVALAKHARLLAPYDREVSEDVWETKLAAGNRDGTHAAGEKGKGVP